MQGALRNNKEMILVSDPQAMLTKLLSASGTDPHGTLPVTNWRDS